MHMARDMGRTEAARNHETGMRRELRRVVIATRAAHDDARNIRGQEIWVHIIEYEQAMFLGQRMACPVGQSSEIMVVMPGVRITRALRRG
jgi:hypothetical protein